MRVVVAVLMVSTTVLGPRVPTCIESNDRTTAPHSASPPVICHHPDRVACGTTIAPPVTSRHLTAVARQNGLLVSAVDA